MYRYIPSISHFIREFRLARLNMLTGDIQMKGVVNGTLRVAMARAGEADVFSRRSVHRVSSERDKACYCDLQIHFGGSVTP